MIPFHQKNSFPFLPNLKKSSVKLNSPDKSYFQLEKGSTNKSALYYPEQIYERLSIVEPSKKNLSKQRKILSSMLQEDRSTFGQNKSVDGRDVSEDFVGLERQQLIAEIKKLRLQVAYYKRSKLNVSSLEYEDSKSQGLIKKTPAVEIEPVVKQQPIVKSAQISTSSLGLIFSRMASMGEDLVDRWMVTLKNVRKLFSAKTVEFVIYDASTRNTMLEMIPKY